MSQFARKLGADVAWQRAWARSWVAALLKLRQGKGVIESLFGGLVSECTCDWSDALGRYTASKARSRRHCRRMTTPTPSLSRAGYHISRSRNRVVAQRPLPTIQAGENMTMNRKRVLITGAAGYLSRQLLAAFRERYDLVLLDRHRPDDIGDIIEVDLTNPDIDAYREHFKGVDAVVHNTRSTRAGVDTSAPRQWLENRAAGDLEGYYVERESIDMAYHVLRLAQEEGVKRVVTASSNHATDWYESKLHNGSMDYCDHTTYPLSDNFYGWAKIAYENLGFIFATGRFGTAVENIHIRIVVPRAVDGARLADNQISYKRDLAGRRRTEV